jgi:quinol monooxygenase YgiN
VSSGEVKVVVRYRVQPGKLEQAKREVRVLIAQVLPEEGCRGITMLEGVSDPNELLLDELWSDAETYLGPHSETPYLRSFKARAGDFLAAPPEITLWRVAE